MNLLVVFLIVVSLWSLATTFRLRLGWREEVYAANAEMFKGGLRIKGADRERLFTSMDEVTTNFLTPTVISNTLWILGAIWFLTKKSK